MTKHPDVNAIWCYNDPSCLGAGAVVRSSGKKAWVEGKNKGIVITGANGSTRRRAGRQERPDHRHVGSAARSHGPRRRRAARHAPEGRQAAVLAAEDVVVPMTIWDAKNIAGTSIRSSGRSWSAGPAPWVVKK